MDFAALCPEVEDTLHRIEARYCQVPGLILTESDLKCVLYKELSEIPRLSQPVFTRDWVFATPVHTEVSWFDEAGALTITSDLAILDPRHLRILERPLDRPLLYEQAKLRSQRAVLRRGLGEANWQPLPNKKYEFGGTAINFELKFAREGVDRIFKPIREDYDKIKRLQGVLEKTGSESEIFHYIVIFSRYNSRSNAFYEWVNQCNEEPYIRVMWCHTSMWLPGYMRQGTQRKN
jgi:hypothetical protein